MSNPSVESVLLRVIDQGLDILGENPKKALFYHLEKTLGISLQDSSTNVKRIEEALKAFFGSGYSYLDAIFRLNLQNALGKNLEKYQSFSECIDYLAAKLSDGVK